jgi:hypothetical protein
MRLVGFLGARLFNWLYSMTITNEDLWGADLFGVFGNHINEQGWLTSDWADILEEEVPKWDKDYVDNPLYGATYSRMYNTDFEDNEDETLIRPIN